MFTWCVQLEMKEGQVDVYRNNMDGLTSTDMSIRLQHKDTMLTPYKALLAQKETNMLLLTPGPKQRHSIYQVFVPRVLAGLTESQLGLCEC